MKRAALSAVTCTLFVAACFSEHVTSVAGGGNADIAALCGSNPGPAVVQIRNHAFTPAQLTVAPGTTVTWANCDDDIHSSTSDASSWDSGMLPPRTSYSRTMPAVGNFPYHCEPHPFMTAAIRVQ